MAFPRASSNPFAGGQRQTGGEQARSCLRRRGRQGQGLRPFSDRSSRLSLSARAQDLAPTRPARSSFERSPGSPAFRRRRRQSPPPSPAASIPARQAPPPTCRRETRSHVGKAFQDFIESVRHIEHRHPDRRRSWIMLNSRSASAADNAAVGSSITMSRAFNTSARAMLIANFPPSRDPWRSRQAGPAHPPGPRSGRRLGDGAPVDHAEPRLFRHAQHDVLDDRHARNERELLMDEAHAELVGDMGAIRDDTLALDENVAVVRLCRRRGFG